MKRFFIVIFLFVSLPIFADYYRTSVTASYYAEDFHGKKTSNGEKFNMNALTCAHKMLPFNTIARVTNLANGKTVDVRVNDRGPFVGTREMDLSKAAAVKLDMIRSGTAKVNIQILSLGENNKISTQTAQKACQIAKVKYNTNFTNSIKTKSPSKSAVTEKKSPTDEKKKQAHQSSENNLWDIQIASFKNRKNAEQLAGKLMKDGFKDVAYQTSQDVVRVVIKKVSDEKLESVKKSLSSKGYSIFLVKKRDETVIKQKNENSKR